MLKVILVSNTKIKIVMFLMGIQENKLYKSVLIFIIVLIICDHTLFDWFSFPGQFWISQLCFSYLGNMHV